MKSYLLKTGWKRYLLFLSVPVLFIGLVSNVVLAQQEQSTPVEAAGQVEEIQTLSNNLVNLLTLYKSPLTSEAKKRELLASMITTAVNRKYRLNLLLGSGRHKEFLQAATLAARRNEFPDQVKQHLEESVWRRGGLLIHHIDNFQTGKSTPNYFFIHNNIEKTRYRLLFAQGDPGLVGGIEFSILGVTLDKNIVVNSANNLKDVSFPRRVQSTGLFKTKVILVNFKADQRKPVTTQYIKNLFNPGGFIYNFYKENSYFQMYTQADVYDWVTIDDPIDTCVLSDWQRWADKAERAAGISFPLNQHFVYVFPYIQACDKIDTLGGATLGAMPFTGNTRAWIFSPTNRNVYLHELGHSINLTHANSYLCLEANNYTDWCTSILYGDIFDVMSSSGAGSYTPHFNTAHKHQAGWVANDKVKTIQFDGTYTVNALEEEKSPVVVRIPKEDQGVFYYIDYRQPRGLDSTLPASIFNGVLIYIMRDDLLSGIGGIFRSETNLIDLVSNGTNVFEVLSDGKSFYDKINKILITQKSHNSSSATIEVKFDYTSPSLQPAPAVGLIKPCLDAPSAPSDEVVRIFWGNSAVEYVEISTYKKYVPSGVKDTSAPRDFRNALGLPLIINPGQVYSAAVGDRLGRSQFRSFSVPLCTPRSGPTPTSSPTSCTPGAQRYVCTGNRAGCALDAGEARKYQCKIDGSGWDLRGGECTTQCAQAVCTGNMSFSCPKALNATWDIATPASGSCNIYIRAGSTDHQISTSCRGSWSGNSVGGVPLAEDGTYGFFVSNGTTCNNQSKGTVTVNCQ